MLDTFNYTFTFKQIFPTLDDWLTFVGEYTDIPVGERSAELTALYKNLFAFFCNSNVNYDTIDGFKRMFGITLSDEFERYVKRLSIITSIYNLTNDELTTVNTGITNHAYNPNTEVPDPLNTILTYISEQTSTKVNLSKLDAYLRALDDFTNRYIRDMIDKFKSHFIQVLITGYPIFGEPTK